MTKARLQYLLDVSPAVIYSSKPSGDYSATFISENVREQTGYEPHEFIDDPKFWSGHIHPDDFPRVLDELPGILEHGNHSHEYRFMHKDGDYRWMYDEARLVRDEDGNPLEIVGYWIDVSKLKEAEGRLRESEKTARALLNAPPDSALLIGIEGTVLDINETAAQRLRTTVDETKGKCVWDFLPPDLAESRKKKAEQVISTGNPVRFEDVRFGRYMYNSAYPIFDPMGRVTRLALFSADITERKLAEDALKASEEKYRTILESMEEGYYEGDLAGNFTFFNDSMCRLLGYSRDELVGMNNRQFMDQENAIKVYETFNGVYTTGKPDKGTDWGIHHRKT
jgi:PAS domain S-box-containing protein